MANWLWSLSVRSLVSFICFCLLLFIVNVAIILSCSRDGCHVFGESTDGSIPRLSDFVYSQFPLILSVGLGFLWILPHHNIVRLEPYYRMSTKDGAKASDSLFLEYPYDIGLFVPFKSLWKKHFVVAISSAILFLMNILVIPVIPSIFDITVVMAASTGKVTPASFEIANRTIPTDFTYSAYDYAWHNGILPRLITEQYAILPLEPEGYKFTTNEDWRVDSKLFEAELQCVGARPPVIGYVNSLLTLNITSMDGREVHLCDAGGLEQGRAVLSSDCDGYTGFITPWTSISLQLGNGDASSYMFAWASGPSSPPDITPNFRFPAPMNITAIFCKPLYYSQNVNTTIRMPSGKVLGVTRSGQRKKIPSPLGFDDILSGYDERNFTNELLVQGIPELSQIPVRFGYPLGEAASVRTDLLARFGSSSAPIQTVNLGRSSTSSVFMTRMNSISAFSLSGYKNDTLYELLEERTLEETHRRALKLFFAFAVARVIADERKVPTVIIKVNRGWALAGATGLTFVMLLTTLLVILIKRRPLNLDREPDSLAASLQLLSNSEVLCKLMEWAEYKSLRQFSQEINGKYYFKLELVDEQGPKVKVMSATDGTEVGANDPVPLVPVNKDLQGKQWTCTSIIGAVSLVCLPLVLVLLIISFVASQKNGGISIPDGPNTFRSKLLYSYLPITIGSAIEPILITLGANYCMAGPYRALKTKKATFFESLAVKFDRLPPHFQIVSSFRHREYALAALSLAILLSNIFPITLAGLYYPTPYTPQIPRSHSILRNFTSPREEMYIHLGKNITSPYSLTWTTRDFYIDPPYEVAPGGEGHYSTTGFGIDISCTSMPDSLITFPCSPQYNNSTSPICTDYSHWENFLSVENHCGNDERIGMVWNGTCTDNIIAMETCNDRIFPIWVENKRYTVNPPGPVDSYHAVVLNCSVVDRIVNLQATVKGGQVLSITNAHPLEKRQILSHYPTSPNTITPLSRSFVEVLRQGLNKELITTGNHMMTRINNLMSMLDERVARGNDTHVPDGKAAAAAFETVIRALFAVRVRMNAGEIFGAGLDQEGFGEVYRMHVGKENFAVAMVVVLFSCVVVGVLFCGLHGVVQGHLPYTLAGVFSHLYQSNAMVDIKTLRGTEKKNRKAKCGGTGIKYAYGEDGAHYGVYRVEEGGEVLKDQSSKDQASDEGEKMPEVRVQEAC